MKGKGKICRIDDWDKPEAVKGKSWSHQERLCDLREKVSLLSLIHIFMDNSGLSVKYCNDILIVLKMLIRFADEELDLEVHNITSVSYTHLRGMKK